jgi:hypothetical protein
MSSKIFSSRVYQKRRKKSSPSQKMRKDISTRLESDEKILPKIYRSMISSASLIQKDLVYLVSMPITSK